MKVDLKTDKVPKTTIFSQLKLSETVLKTVSKLYSNQISIKLIFISIFALYFLYSKLN